MACKHISAEIQNVILLVCPVDGVKLTCVIKFTTGKSDKEQSNIVDRHFPIHCISSSAHRVNNGESPVIVIDAMGILGLAADNQHEIFCGGRHKRYHDMFNKLFSDLIECGATLVFFSDLNIQQWKSDVWLARRDRKYADDCKLFDNIKRGLSVKQFRPTHSGKYCKLVEHALRDAGTKHGTYNYTTKHDCDAELAKYARDHNALAVIAHDSDFLIFEGYWEYWSAVDIDVNALTTVEFNRKALRQHLQLTHKQMPLLATLMGNDYTKANSLRTLYETEWGDNVQRWLNVAKLVRQLGEAAFDVSDEGIAHISAHVFGKNDNEGTRTMIRDSMQSYNLDFVMYEETDALLQKIVHVPDVYEMLTSPILTINMTMYDMREEMVGPLYPLVIAELNKRCVGLLFKQRNMKHSYEFFAKFSHNEKFTSTTMQPVFPPKSGKSHNRFDLYSFIEQMMVFNFLAVKIPPLIDLLLKEDKQITSPLNTTRLKALLWLLTLEAKYLERIRSVPRAYRLIAVTLKFMRQVSPSSNHVSSFHTILIYILVLLVSNSMNKSHQWKQTSS